MSHPTATGLLIISSKRRNSIILSVLAVLVNIAKVGSLSYIVNYFSYTTSWNKKSSLKTRRESFFDRRSRKNSSNPTTFCLNSVQRSLYPLRRPWPRQVRILKRLVRVTSDIYYVSCLDSFGTCCFRAVNLIQRLPCLLQRGLDIHLKVYRISLYYISRPLLEVSLY